MKLTWEDYPALAAALDKAYPDADLLNLEHGDLVEMVNALPGFEGPATPPAGEILDAILYAWVGLGEDEGRWDAHV